MATALSSSAWASEFEIKQLKLLSKLIPSSSAAACLERSDLEALVHGHYNSRDQAQSTLHTLSKIQQVLAQDRGNVNFTEYTPSSRHEQRLEHLRKIAPELYDNPTITPRSTWFSHPMYRRNSQMPPFHVHFRQELQTTVAYLYDALTLASSTADHHKQIARKVESASRYFHACMRGLNGHVSIEEYACFPLYQEAFPNVNLKFLCEDHRELHQSEAQVGQALDDFLKQMESKKDNEHRTGQLLELLGIVLDFDEHLMQHLGEEEELVVPLSLTDRPIHF